MTEMPVQSKGSLCASLSSTCRSHALLWHPVSGSVVAEVMSLHRDHGMSSTWSPRVAFPEDSWGNFQPIHPWKEQQSVQTMLPLLLHSPSLPAPDRVTSHLPVKAPSFAHPAIYWLPTTSGYLRNEQTKPTRPKDAEWGCTQWCSV